MKDRLLTDYLKDTIQYSRDILEFTKNLNFEQFREDKQIIGRQLVEKDRFIERIYFEDDFNIPTYFAKVKANPKAWKLSRMYESKFRAKDIKLRVLKSHLNLSSKGASE